jgi:hypothetical protein
VLVQADDKVVVFLPGCIVISKNILISNARNDIEMTLLLMEALFNRKTHIKELALTNLLHFISHWVRPTNVSDINMLKIYSRTY